MAELITRPALHGDLDFCWDIYSESVKGVVAPMIQGGWNHDNEKAKFRSIWSTENAHIVLVDSVPVGWFACRFTDAEVVIEHAYFQASHQRRKIGTIIVNFIAEEAKKRGKNSVIVEVVKGASAKTFFEKLGFVELGTSPTSLCIPMQRST